MSFGFSSLIDLLSWLAVASLALKVAATIILLRRDGRRWFESPLNAALYWSTKITPLVAVPCLIAIAVIEHDRRDVWFFSAAMVYVLIAVPLTVWRRFHARPNGV
jgi:hypothetical protein